MYRPSLKANGKQFAVRTSFLSVAPSRGMASALNLIKKEHEEVKSLMDGILNEDNLAKKREQLNTMIKMLSQHSALEEQLVYPAMTYLGSEDLSSGSRDDHLHMKDMLAQLDAMHVQDGQFSPTLEKLKQVTLAHMKKEEDEAFKVLSEGLSQDQLEKMGSLYETMKPLAPTRPHPRIPDTFPGNALVGPLVAFLDNVRDLGRKVSKPIL